MPDDGGGARGLTEDRWAVAVALAAALGPALRVVPHGAPNRVAAVMLVGVALLWGVGSRAVARAARPVAVGVPLVALGGLGLALVLARLGRATVVVPVLLVAAAEVARWRFARSRPEQPDRPGALLAGVAVTSGLWLVTGSVALVVALVLVGSVVADLAASPSLLRTGARSVAHTAEAVLTAARHAAGRGRAAAGSAGRRTGAGLGRRGRTVADAARAEAGGWHLRRADVAAAAAVGAVVSVVLAPVFHRLATELTWGIQGINDYGEHLVWAEQGQWPWRPPVPHFLLHGLTRGLAVAVGFPRAMAVVLAVAAGATASATYALGRADDGRGRRLAPPAAVLLAVVTLVGESPYVLVGGPAECCDGRPPYAPLHIWGNPTVALVLPFAVALVPSLVAGLAAPARGWRARPVRDGGVALLVVLSALAKPSLAMVLVPAALALAALGGPDRGARVRWVARVAVVPAAIVAAGQALHTATSTSVLENPSGVAIDPLVLARQVLDGRPQYWAILWPVALGLWAGGRRYLRTPDVALALLSLLAALPPVLLLVETGDRAGHGNLAWGLYLGIVLTFVTSVRFLLVELAERSRGRAWWRVPAWAYPTAALLAATVAAGLVAYLEWVEVLPRAS